MFGSLYPPSDCTRDKTVSVTAKILTDWIIISYEFLPVPIVDTEPVLLSPQSKFWAWLRLTEYQPVSWRAERVMTSIRTRGGSANTAAIMEPCRTRASQCEEKPWESASWEKRFHKHSNLSYALFNILASIVWVCIPDFLVEHPSQCVWCWGVCVKPYSH